MSEDFNLIPQHVLPIHGHTNRVGHVIGTTYFITVNRPTRLLWFTADEIMNARKMGALRVEATGKDTIFKFMISEIPIEDKESAGIDIAKVRKITINTKLIK